MAYPKPGVQFAVIETRKTERLVATPATPPPIGALETLRREADGTEVYQSIVPVLDGRRIDGGRWPVLAEEEGR